MTDMVVTETLSQAVERQAREIERLYEWQRQMVELAASGGRLDGYRELAAKLAKKDEQIDRLRAEIERLRGLLREASGPMSYGRWSTDFRHEVKAALGDE
jgi:hypothetical protein